MFELTLIILTLLVALPPAIQSCIYLIERWQQRKHSFKKSQPDLPEISMVHAMNEDDTTGKKAG